MAEKGGNSKASGSGVRRALDVDSLLRDLKIKDDDFDDLVIDEDVTIDEEPDLLAVARVLTDKSFSSAAFEDTMRFAWALAQKVEFRDVGNNTFILQLSCLGDWKKVVEEGPWLFRNWGIVIQPYDGYSKPSSMILDRLPIWIQIHDIPEAYVKKKEILQNLAGRIGKFVKVDTESSGGGNFVRVRVEIDVNKPLERFTSVIRKGVRHVFIVKYEKAPKFCEICGFLGHEFEECGNGFHKPEDHVFGEWMIADVSRRGRGRGRGPRGGRDRGFGTGRGGRGWGSSDWNPPAKPADVDNFNARKRPDGTMASVELGQEKENILAITGKDTEMMNVETVAAGIELPIKIREKKRMKTDAFEEEELNSEDISATSLGEDRREQ
jgi:hypothetical protein